LSTQDPTAPITEYDPTGLQRLLEHSDRFLFAVETETTRSLSTDRRAVETTAVARELADSDQIDLICISDNPFGSPHNSPEVLGRDLLARGQEVVVNFSCKDHNRNGIESRLWALGSSGLRNILAITGDYPRDGLGGMPRPVFDIDSVGLLELTRRMNQGLPGPRRTRGRAPDYRIPQGSIPARR